MKRLVALTIAAALLPTAYAANVGVTVEFSQPGVYGRVDIGRLPTPAVIIPQPVIVAPAVAVAPAPIYMWVPPGHRKKWSKHCREYNACGVPVYFVRDDWYDDHIRDKDKHPGSGKGKGHGRN